MSELTVPQVIRVQPDYESENVNLTFENKYAYNNWSENVLSKHATYIFKDSRELKKDGHYSMRYLCECNGTARNSSSSSSSATSSSATATRKKRKTDGISKKVGCKSKYTVHFYSSGSITVDYSWTHNGHDPADLEDIIKSRLPVEIRKWIDDCVDRHMNLQSINSLLRMNNDQLDEVKSGEKNETQNLQYQVRRSLDVMMYAKTVDSFNDAWLCFKDAYEEKFKVFFTYFEQYWFNRKNLWSRAFRLVNFIIIIISYSALN
ncbi:unnamed protein product [Absidia cylindrospora]